MLIIRLSIIAVLAIVAIISICAGAKSAKGLLLQLIGGGCNILALAANGWTMPYNEKCGGDDYMHTYMTISNMKMWYLCDVIYCASIGDIMIYMGLVVVIINVVTKRKPA